MALHALRLRKELDDTKKKLEECRAKAEALATREAELEQAINEASTDEDKQLVDANIAEYEAEKAENDKETAELEKQCEDLERELAETEEKTNTPPPAPAAEEERGKELPVMENLSITSKRARELFGKMSDAQRVEMFEREDVKKFNEQIRTCITEKRALPNVGVLIPEVYLGLIRENIERYSKL